MLHTTGGLASVLPREPTPASHSVNFQRSSMQSNAVKADSVGSLRTQARAAAQLVVHRRQQCQPGPLPISRVATSRGRVQQRLRDVWNVQTRQRCGSRTRLGVQRGCRRWRHTCRSHAAAGCTACAAGWLTLSSLLASTCAEVRTTQRCAQLSRLERRAARSPLPLAAADNSSCCRATSSCAGFSSYQELRHAHDSGYGSLPTRPSCSARMGRMGWATMLCGLAEPRRLYFARASAACTARRASLRSCPWLAALQANQLAFRCCSEADSISPSLQPLSQLGMLH